MTSIIVDLLEIIILSVILFVQGTIASIVISLIFTQITNHNDTVDDPARRKAGIIFLTLFELIVIAFAYYIITQLTVRSNYIKHMFVDIFGKWSDRYKKIMGHKKGFKTVEYVLHIVLIILLIELNHSMKINLERTATILTGGQIDDSRIPI
jgi:hypothetical protein